MSDKTEIEFVSEQAEEIGRLIEKECCANCDSLFEMEDWHDFPQGQFFRKVCGLFVKEKRVMALYGDLTIPGSLCEGFKRKDGGE